jgi:hypothetical protein
MRYCFLVLFVVLGLSAHAQQDCSANLIPKELLPYASSVIRHEETTIEIKDVDNVIYHVKKAITVLNKNGAGDANIAIWHNKSRIIKDIKGVLYDEFGKPVSKFSESAFTDQNILGQETLFDDSRVKYFEPGYNQYPYTIEYEYELRSKESLDIEGWEPNPGIGIAVEKGTYTIICKPDFIIRYKEINMPLGVDANTDNDSHLKTYKWQVNNLKAIKQEPMEPSPDKYLTMVKISSEKFIFGGMQGSYTTWGELGKWVYDNLLVNRSTVSPATAEYVKQLTAGITDPKVKAKKIYEYMQNRTHYINVSIGIGGVQPIPASEVDKVNYGDCKALVNYTQALLKVADIDSYYCEVQANEGNEKKVSFMQDFASMDQGNHIILCLPFKNDTTWCDCTSQTLPFGYLGEFTDDRAVLACTPEGGKLLRTPKYTTADNLQQRKASFNISADGALSGDMTTIFKGVNYEDREYVIAQSLKEQLKTMPDYYPITNIDIEKLQFKQDKTLDPSTTENITFSAPEYASADDGKLNFLLNATNRVYNAPKQVMNRKTDVYINEGSTEDDEIIYTLPAGYHSDSNDLDVSIKEPFGTFKATSTIKDGKLIYKRRLQVIDGTYSKDKYQDLVDFYRSVADADTRTVTLVKN